MQPKIKPVTRKADHVQRRPRNLTTTTPQCGVCRLQAIISRRQKAFLSHPGRSSRLPQRLSVLPESSSRSNPQHFISYAPIAHHVLRGSVRPLQPCPPSPCSAHSCPPPPRGDTSTQRNGDSSTQRKQERSVACVVRWCASFARHHLSAPESFIVHSWQVIEDPPKATSFPRNLFSFESQTLSMYSHSP